MFASVGWFLENYQKTFHVSNQYLSDLEKHRPQSSQYMLRNQRSGTLLHRWNLVLPDELKIIGGPMIPSREFVEQAATRIGIFYKNEKCVSLCSFLCKYANGLHIYKACAKMITM